MKYECTIFLKETNEVIFRQIIEGNDKRHIGGKFWSAARMVVKQHGGELIGGKRPSDIKGKVNIKMEQVDYDYKEHEARALGGSVSAAQRKATEKYQKENTRLMSIRLNLNTDADIIQRLEEVRSKQGYIKELIRADIEARG